MTIDDETKDPTGRYAVRSHKNKELMSIILEDSPEGYILHKMDTDAKGLLFEGVFGEGEAVPWEGKSADLYDLLSECGSFSAQRRFSKLCPTPRILAAQLKTMRRNFPDRVIYSSDLKPRKINGCEYWRIMPPSGCNTDQDATEEDCF
jgi:hypothetical protein